LGILPSSAATGLAGAAGFAPVSWMKPPPRQPA
jgi:hypothetical protein